MFNTGQLALEQAPPIAVPFRFFLTAPAFGLAAGLLLAVQGEALFVSRWDPGTLAFTHLLTLGLLGLVMAGALLQMLPVVAGSPVPRVRAVGITVHALLSAGSAALVAGFLGGGDLWMRAALFLLGGGFLLFVTAVAVSLARVPLGNPSVAAMRLAVAALVVTVVLGLTLGSTFGWDAGLAWQLGLTNVHLAWGLLGWVGLLVTGVAYQVVPMFQITPDYPRALTRALVPALFGLLGLWSALYPGAAVGPLPAWLPAIGLTLVGGAFTLFAAATLTLQHRRRRKVDDTTLRYWRLAMAGVASVFLLWCAGLAWPGLAASPAYPLLLGVGLLFGFAVPVVTGMLFKIVPFLSWFHLQNRQMALMRLDVVVPHMREFLPERRTRLQYRVYLAALALLVAAVLRPELAARPAGMALALACGLLWLDLLRAWLRYRTVQRAFGAGEETP